MRKGRNGIEQKIDHSKASNSVMFCRSAAREILPPMVVYKAMFLNDGWASADLNGAIYHSTDSGWFDGRTFKQWFKELFVLNLNGAFAIIGDNLGSHFREEFIELYSKKKHTLYNTGAFGPV